MSHFQTKICKFYTFFYYIATAMSKHLESVGDGCSSKVKK